MNRREARENAFITLFAAQFGSDVQEALEAGREVGDYAVDEFGEGLLALYQANAPQVDSVIEARLKGWKMQRLQKVSAAILRISVAEMLYGTEDLDSVIINEAVEITKKYGGEDEYQFVNGVLGSVSREEPKAAGGAAPKPNAPAGTEEG